MRSPLDQEALEAFEGRTTLLEILTRQILSGMPIEEARQIVMNHAFYRRRAITNQAPPAKLREIELDAIRQALDRNHWHRGLAARDLGISKQSLRRAIKEMDEGTPCRAFSASA